MEQISFNWLLVFFGFGAILLELFIGVETGFDLVLVGSSLIIGGLVGSLTDSWETGVLVAIFLAFAYIFFGRKYIKSRLSIAAKTTNIDKLIGKEAIVVKEIKKYNAGQVKIGSEVWRAEGSGEFAKKQKVKVVSVEGVTLRVEKVV